MDQLPGAFNFDIPQPISTDIAMYGGIFAKRHVIPAAGSYVPQHSHTYDHLSLLVSGRMRAWCGDECLGDFEAPAEIRIPAHKQHTFLTLDDNVTFYCVHNADQFEEEDYHTLPGALKPGAAPKGDGVVFAIETLDAFLAEDSPLFYEHCLSVGEPADQWKDKNWAVSKRLEVQGGLFLMTARKDGVLVGYLMAIAGPALDEIGDVDGLFTLFYTSPKHPGLGIRIHRAAIEMLRARGVTTIVFRAGHRGMGPRLSALYRRLGATPSGKLFALSLKDAD